MKFTQSSKFSPQSINEHFHSLNSDKKTDSFRYLTSVNNTSERMWKIFFKVIAVIIAMNTVVLPLVSFFSDPNSEVENFHHPLPFVYRKKFKLKFVSLISIFSPDNFSLPWDQTTLIGYFEEMVFTAVVAFAFWFTNGVFLIFFTSICIHHRAFYEIFKHSVEKFNRRYRNTKSIRELIYFYMLIKKQVHQVRNFRVSIDSKRFHFLFLQLVFAHGRRLQFHQCCFDHFE